MKKSVLITLFIFWAIVVSILVAGLLNMQTKKTADQPLASASQATTPALPKSQSTVSTNTGLTAAAVAKHASASDCYLIINSKVYDVTPYLDQHPAGPDVITPYCGQDATQAFATKGGRGAHSDYAYSLLANYLIGDLVK